MDVLLAMFTCNELRETLQTDDIARNCTRNRKQRPAATAKPYSPGGAWHIVVPPGEYDWTYAWCNPANSLNLCFLWPTQVHNPNSKSIGSAIFAELTAENAYTSQWAPLFPRKHELDRGPDPSWEGVPMVWSEPLSNSWFLGIIWAHNLNGIWIGSAIFCTDDRRVPYIPNF